METVVEAVQTELRGLLHQLKFPTHNSLSALFSFMINNHLFVNRCDAKNSPDVELNNEMNTNEDRSHLNKTREYTYLPFNRFWNNE